jgi:hypothetical protein
MINVHIHRYEPGGDVDDAGALEQFQKQWATCQKMVDTDSLSHKEVSKILHAALAARGAPTAFLDIACGDASQMKTALAGVDISHYHGIDLSGPALELAAKNLAAMPFPVDLDEEDFIEALTKRPEPADVAWCSLSIHHLQTEGKLDLLRAIRENTGDFLMIYEPTRADGETREGYLERFRHINRPAWTFFSPDEWAQIDHHVTTSDYPEPAATWVELGREAGFGQAKQLFLDRTGFYGLYRYDR